MAEISCLRVQEHLSDYVDRALGPGLDRQISAHLEVCDHCREELRALRTLLAASAQWGGRTIPRDITDSVMTRIVSQRSPAAWWRRIAQPVLAVPAGAAVAALLVLTLLLPQNPPPRGRMIASAVDREIPMAKDYAIFRSEQAFSGGDGVLLLAEIESAGSTEATP
jgi:anti-sigma factor RsiW